MTQEEFKQACYEAYQLDWMLSHGYSLNDFLHGIAEAEEEARYSGEFPTGGTLDVYDSLRNDFEDQGFNGSLDVCKDEFLNAEFKDPMYMKHLIDCMRDSEARWKQYTEISKPATQETTFQCGTSTDKFQAIEQIVAICFDMNPNDHLRVFDYGENGDLLLDIYKDEDYDRTKGEYNLVTIFTSKSVDGKIIAVDDTEDTYVGNGELDAELERIYHYQDFSTL